MIKTKVQEVHNMEWMIDTADLTKIKELIEYYPICGVTSNPSIVKKAAPQDFFAHMREIRKCIGKERSLHIQVTARTAEDMLAEARLIHEKVDDAVYIKIPRNKMRCFQTIIWRNRMISPMCFLSQRRIIWKIFQTLCVIAWKSLSCLLIRNWKNAISR